ncbi:MAG: hypothetical protein M0R80_05475 [Proteobacteria bacterium]|jgi:Ca2+-binding RTX toxin-like protein|nr:hypothetical protein [Pseudomonadota bacterium]
MKKKMLFAAGVSLLAIFASVMFAANAWAVDDSQDDVDLWQVVSERLGDSGYWTYDLDGELEFEDLGALMDRLAEELGVSVGGSGGGGFLDTDNCSTTGSVITCTVSTPSRYVVVGKKEGTDDIIMCECATIDGTYTETGKEAHGSTTGLRVYGTTGQDAIKLVRSGASDVTGCSFDDFPTWFSAQILVDADDAYDWVYGSDDEDDLYGEYVMGYADSDDIYIDQNMPATEYGFGGDGDDIIIGNAGAEELYGQNDADEVYGNGGADLIRGGPGNDYLEGGNGGDRIYGDGPDSCDDYNDQDTILGGLDNDVLWGQCGDDKLDSQGGTGDVCHGETNIGGGMYIGDGCSYSYCETYDGCEYDWDAP